MGQQLVGVCTFARIFCTTAMMVSNPCTTSMCPVFLVHTIVGVPGTCLYMCCVVVVLPFVFRSVLSQASGILFWQLVCWSIMCVVCIGAAVLPLMRVPCGMRRRRAAHAPAPTCLRPIGTVPTALCQRRGVSASGLVLPGSCWFPAFAQSMLPPRRRLQRAHPESITRGLWVPLSRAHPCVFASCRSALALRRGYARFVPFPVVAVYAQQT